ncbi:F-box protein At2g26160-like [Carex rostrata]
MEKKEIIEMERNWADLPMELFLLILKNIPDICVFVRSRAVCKPWRFSSSVSDLPPQFPWIFGVSRGTDLQYYSIDSKKLHTIRARGSSSRRFFKPSGAYMLTSQIGDYNSFSLLNPLNNKEVHLPVRYDCDPCLFTINFSWSNPPIFQIDDYMYVSENEISVRCKPSDDNWEIIRPRVHECQYNCHYLMGFLFRVDFQTGVTKILDIINHRELYVIPPPDYEKISKMYFGGPYLVESCGEILTIAYNQSYEGTHYKFYIHRLEFGNGKGNPCWVKLSTIGDRMLFFENPLGYGHAFSLSASDFAGLKGDCIYFINKVSTSSLGQTRVINMYDVENGETKFIDTPFNRKNNTSISWFMPTLNHI